MATTSTKKKTPSKAEQERQRTKASVMKKQKAQRASLFLFALSIFLIALSAVNGENLWQTLHRFYFGLFGAFTYAVGPLVLVLAVMTAYERTPTRNKTVLSVLLILSVCGALLIFGQQAENVGAKPTEQFAELYENGINVSGGGLISAVFGWTLLRIFGKTGAAITVLLFIFVFSMLLFGKSLVDIITIAAKLIVRGRDKYMVNWDNIVNEQMRRESERANKSAETAGSSVKRSKNIDIPLDGEYTVNKAKTKNRSRIDISLGDDMPPERETDTASSDISSENGDKLFSELQMVTEDILQPPPPPRPRTENSQPVQSPPPSRERIVSSFDAASREASMSGAASVVRDVFENRERELRENDRLFAKFSEQEAPEGELDSLIRKAAGDELSSDRTYDTEEAAQQTKLASLAEQQYRFPPMTLLRSQPKNTVGDVSGELRANADFLVSTLESFGVKTKIVDISRGPTVTRYELQPQSGVRLSRITALSDDIALALATAGVRIEAPIPNKAAVGIEVPNKVKNMVCLRTVVESDEFKKAKSPLTVALGQDITGSIMVTDIAKMPHLLIAGTTGSGKSCCLHSMIVSLIYKSAPKDLRFVFIDPKMVEFGVYNGIPHMLIPVVTDPRKAAGALGWAVGEMLKRYKKFSETGVRDIDSYNRYVDKQLADPQADTEEGEPLEKMARVVIVIDELSDLMMAAPNEVEDSICRLAQMARAAGLHLIIATQRPSVDVITGVIKANISSRIALSVSSSIDSRTIIDSSGAEKLIGNGDMLFLPIDLPKPVRIQGCYVSDDEIEKVIGFVKKNAVIEYNEQVLAEIERQAAKEKGKGGSSSYDSDDTDPMLDNAIEAVIEAGQAATSLLQRRLKVGYGRAARMMDEMEQMGIIGPPDGNKPRAVLMTMAQFRERQLTQDAKK